MIPGKDSGTFDLKLTSVPKLTLKKVIVRYTDTSEQTFYDMESMLHSLMVEHAATQKELFRQRAEIQKLRHRLNTTDTSNTYVCEMS